MNEIKTLGNYFNKDIMSTQQPDFEKIKNDMLFDVENNIISKEQYDTFKIDILLLQKMDSFEVGEIFEVNNFEFLRTNSGWEKIDDSHTEEYIQKVGLTPEEAFEKGVITKEQLEQIRTQYKI